MNEFPHSPEAERALLGSIFVSSEVLPEIADQITPADFYVSAYRQTYAAMLEVAENGLDLDPLIVANELRRREQLEAVGGVVFLASLLDGIPRVAFSLNQYVQLLREKSKLRRAIYTANEIINRASEPDAESSVVLTWADEQVSKQSAASDKSNVGFRSFQQISQEAGERYDRYWRGVGDAIPTGFRELDAHLAGGGVAPTDVVIIAGTPGSGKTALGLDIAVNCARAGVPAAFVSLEMESTALFTRVVAAESGVARWKIKPGILESDFKRIEAQRGDLEGLPLYVDDSVATVVDLRRRARELVRRHGVKLLVVDYLQLLRPWAEDRRHGSRNDEVSEVSRSLKALARELRIPVIALSQLSRDHVKHNREPQLSDLRDSGQIEQDASTVLFVYGNDPEPGQSFYDRTIKCAKQREGALFKTELPFNGELITFRSFNRVQDFVGNNEPDWMIQ